MGMFPSFRAPETMTAAEQAAILAVTQDAPRDHVLYSMALGTGLRLNELLGLNVGDVSADGRTVRRRIVLSVTKGGRRGEVFLPERLVPKLAKYLSWKRENGQSVGPDAPLFVSGQGRRLSPRAAQWRFAWWQARAGFDRRYNFHSMRHSSITNVYRASKNLFLAQRFARHASPLTTIIYTHPADEELAASVRDLPC
jgi:integrase/recombinase XerC